MAQIEVTKDLENKKLVIAYEVTAPKEKVWKAYADKEWFEKWWGPEGWVTTVKEFNFVTGGTVHYGMKCVDENQGEWFNQESWGVMALESVDAPNKYVYIDYFSDADGKLNQELPAVTVTNEFMEEDGKTRVVSTLLADNAEQIEELIKMGMIEGYQSQLNRIDALFVD